MRVDIPSGTAEDGRVDMAEGPAVMVTGDEMRAEDILKDLREAQAKLEVARTEVASLKVLLALRTHQHDQAWQAARRAAVDLEHLRATTGAGRSDDASADRPAAAASDANPAPTAEAAGAEAVARAEARTDAVRIVLDAVLASLRLWGLDRRRFQTLVVQAGREAPQAGPGAERHAILLAEARRILARTG